MLTSDVFSEFYNFMPSTGMDIDLIFVCKFSLINLCFLCAAFDDIYFTNNCLVGHSGRHQT